MSEACKVVTFGNFKGGTGKTTNCTMIAHSLAKMGYKVLLSDQDPQANATSLFLRTKVRLEQKDVGFTKTLMRAIKEEDLRQIVTPIMDNLDLLPSYTDFAAYPTFLEKRFKKNVDRVKFFSGLLNTIKEDYDFVFIDVPPTISVITDSALYASDYVVVVLQTQERSLDGAKVFTNYLQTLIDNYDADFDILGFLPVLLKNQAPVDTIILDNAKEIFGEENIFTEVVKNMERLKRFDMTGITEDDMHDRHVLKVYKAITEEFLTRLNMESKEMTALAGEGANRDE